MGTLCSRSRSKRQPTTRSPEESSTTRQRIGSTFGQRQQRARPPGAALRNVAFEAFGGLAREIVLRFFRLRDLRDLRGQFLRGPFAFSVAGGGAETDRRRSLRQQ